MSKYNIFNELGLLDEPDPTNPLQTLGLDLEFASGMLIEDPSGQAVQLIAGALAKELSKRYHTDADESGSRERFDEVREAAGRVSNASTAALGRWAVKPRPVAVDAERLRAERDAVQERAVHMHEQSIELASHSDHFRSFTSSIGLVLRQRSAIYLAQPDGNEAFTVIAGSTRTYTDLVDDYFTRKDIQHASQDVSDFLVANKLLDPTPGTVRHLFLDGGPGMRIYDNEFAKPVVTDVELAEKRRARQDMTAREKRKVGSTDMWARRDNPAIITVATANDGESASVLSTTQFDTGRLERSRKKRSIFAWNIPYSVVGSSPKEFANKMLKAPPTMQREALQGQVATADSPIRLASFNIRQFLEQDDAYTPLLTRGNALVLRYVDAARTSIVAEATIAALLR